MALIKWKVDEEPTGRYRSFDKRGWPNASYKDKEESPAARIRCEDEYIPANVKTENHKPLKVYVADWSNRERDPKGTAFIWLKVKGEFVTLKQAKDAAEKIINKYEYLRPKGE